MLNLTDTCTSSDSNLTVADCWCADCRADRTRSKRAEAFLLRKKSAPVVDLEWERILADWTHSHICLACGKPFDDRYDSHRIEVESIEGYKMFFCDEC